MATVADALAQVYGLLQDEKPAQAAGLAARVLVHFPEQAGAIRLLALSAGMVHLKEQSRTLLKLTAALAPDDVNSYGDLASPQQQSDALGLAEGAARTILARRQITPEVISNQAMTAADKGEMARAQALLYRLLALRPQDEKASALWLHNVNLIGGVVPRQHAARRKAWGKRYFGHLPQKRAGAPSPAQPVQVEPIRVGIVGGSTLSRTTHAASLVPLHRHLDPKRVQLFYYSDIDVAQESETSRFFQAGAAGWRRTGRLSDYEMAERMRQDNLHIAVDLVGHLGGDRAGVLARRPAPIQMSYLHVGPSGNPGLDYALVDRFLVPKGKEDSMTEACVRLPCVHLFEMLLPLPPSGPCPAEATGQPVTFGSFNNLAKVTNETLALWSAALLAVPKSRLILKNRGFASADVRCRVSGSFEARGVDPSRIEYHAYSKGFAEHAALLNQVDIALDPTPYVGIITTCEAHLMGIPVLSMPGESVVSGYARSIAHQVGLGDLMVGNPEAFAAKALELAEDWERRAALRRDLPDQFRHSKLGDAKAFADTLSTAFSAMVERYHTGLLPAPFEVLEQGGVQWT